MKRWAMGDVHGNYRGFMQCMERSGFNYKEDELIQVGDLADGYSELHLVMEELLKIKNLILIKGNHDEWFKEWLFGGIHPQSWRQGGTGSFKSYLKLIKKEGMWQTKSSGGYIVALNPADIPESHQKLFKSQVNYYVDDQRNLFIHGGFNRHFKLTEQAESNYYWDRDLWLAALSYEAMSKGDALHGKYVNQFKMKEDFNLIFLGHTATNNWDDPDCEEKKGGLIVYPNGRKAMTRPMKAANIYNIDTGAGFAGKLTIINIDNPEEYYQSDSGADLYPEDIGRR